MATIRQLRSAIRKLATDHPKLATVEQGTISLKVRFFRYSALAHEILQLSGGTGDLKYLLLNYPDIAAKFKHAPMRHSVILFIDNDDGADHIFSAIQSKYHITADWTTDFPFHHL